MKLGEILREILFFYNETAVYLIFGFLVAGLLRALFPESLVRKHMGGNSTLSALKATLFGIPLPLCSCGVVPVTASLRNSGASKGASASFLIATPQVGADSFLLSYSLLGWVFAVFRIAASLLTSLTAGVLINILDGKEESRPADVVESGDETMAEKLRSFFHYIEFELLGSMANTLVAGILIAGLISALVPQDFFANYFNDNLLSMLLMLAIGIPMYVCAASSTPIAASLILKGLSPGAALVFLLTGPATNAIGVSAVYNMMGKKSTVIYLFSIAAVSLSLGAGLNMAVDSFGFDKVIITSRHEALPFWLKISSSILLALMLALYYLKTLVADKLASRDIAAPGALFLTVEGMNCQRCAATVKKAAESVPGTTEVRVDLERKQTRFNIDPDDLESLNKIKSAIQSAGFSVE